MAMAKPECFVYRQQMARRRFRGPLGLSCLVVLSACSSAPSSDDKGKRARTLRPEVGHDERRAEPTERATAPSPGSVPGAREFGLRKQVYLWRTFCWSISFEFIPESEATYREWVDWQRGPRQGDTFSSAVDEIANVTDCVKDFSKALEEEGTGANADHQDFAEAAAAYFSAVTAATDTINNAYRYYDREDHLEDRFQHGRVLHPQLVQAFSYHTRAAERLAGVMARKRREADRLLFERLLKSDSLRYPVLVERIRQAGDDLAELNEQVLLRSFGRYAPEHRDQLTTLIAVLEQAIASLRTALSDDDAIHAAAGEHDPSSMLGEADDLAECSRDVLSALRAGEATTAADAGCSLGLEFPHEFLLVHRQDLSDALGYLGPSLKGESSMQHVVF